MKFNELVQLIEAKKPAGKTAEQLYKKAKKANKRLSASEEHVIIAQDPGWPYWYAKDIIKGRWPEAEPVLAQHPGWAREYARNVIKGRWPEAEPVIASDPDWAHLYAKDVLHRRFILAEASDLITSTSYLAPLHRLNLID